MDGRGTRLDEQGLQTRVPQLLQLCLSLASCAALFDVLAQVNLLAQQELENRARNNVRMNLLTLIDFLFLLSDTYQVSSSSKGVHLGGFSVAARTDRTSRRAS